MLEFQIRGLAAGWDVVSCTPVPNAEMQRMQPCCAAQAEDSINACPLGTPRWMSEELQKLLIAYERSKPVILVSGVQTWVFTGCERFNVDKRAAPAESFSIKNTCMADQKNPRGGAGGAHSGSRSSIHRLTN